VLILVGMGAEVGGNCSHLLVDLRVGQFTSRLRAGGLPPVAKLLVDAYGEEQLAGREGRREVTEPLFAIRGGTGR
jgi:hypothetical protein